MIAFCPEHRAWLWTPAPSEEELRSSLGLHGTAAMLLDRSRCGLGGVSRFSVGCEVGTMVTARFLHYLPQDKECVLAVSENVCPLYVFSGQNTQEDLVMAITKLRTEVDQSRRVERQ